jgi:hypothetical protein
MKTKLAKKAPSLVAVLTSKPGVQRNIVRHNCTGKSTGIRTTNAEISRRIMLVASMISRGAFKSQIHALITKNYHVHWRTVDNYIVRARELLLSGIQKARDELIGESYGFDCSVLRDSDASIGDKLRAQQCIDDLLALRAPQMQRHELSGPNGAPLAGPAAEVVIMWPHEAMKSGPKSQVLLMDNGRGDRQPNGAPALAPPPTPAKLEPEPEAEESEPLPRGVMSGAEFLADN